MFSSESEISEDTSEMNMRNSSSLVLRPLVLGVFCMLAAAAPQSASAQDEYVVARDTVTLWTVNGSNAREVNRVVWWHPDLNFILYGPPGKGYVVWLEAGLPGKKKWFSRECASNPIGEFSDKFRDAQQATEIRCDSSAATDYTGEPTTYTGVVNFSIHLRNELQGITDATLFSGKFKVAKKMERGGYSPEHIKYYVDEDWRIPIGYVTAGEQGGLRAELAFRKSVERPTAYLFYQGKQLEEVSCGSGLVPFAKDAEVFGSMCQFFSVAAKANPYRPTEKYHLLTENPGEYEIKMMSGGRLVRSVKFTVNAEGSFDNGVGAAGKLGRLGVVVPVKVLGTADGPWNKLAWKAEAFYGNPLTGFTAPP